MLLYLIVRLFCFSLTKMNILSGNILYIIYLNSFYFLAGDNMHLLKCSFFPLLRREPSASQPVVGLRLAGSEMAYLMM